MREVTTARAQLNYQLRMLLEDLVGEQFRERDGQTGPEPFSDRLQQVATGEARAARGDRLIADQLARELGQVWCLGRVGRRAR